MAPKIMWIGLGNMGRGMVKNLVEKAPLLDSLIIYNRTRARAETLRSTLPDPSAVTIAESVADGVSAADIIFTCLSDDAAVTSTLETALQSATVAGKVFVDCSTIHPDTTSALGKLVAAAGSDFVAAPVFGAPAMADSGQLVAVLAGARPVLDRVRPYFKGVTARAEIDLSGDTLTAEESWGRATLLKVLGNTFILNMVEQLAEGLTVAEKSGLGTAPLVSFVEAIFPGPYAAYAQRMLTGDYYKREEPLFSVDLARKDLRHATSVAEKAGMRLPNAETAQAHLDRVKERDGSKGDIAGIYGAVREEAGLDFVVFFVLAVVVAASAGTWVFVPRFFPKETQLIWRSSVIMALACCYLMWAITYLAQLNPLVVPKRSNLRA
ncbi:related to gamma hydroxybutyrate dehydrogenase [Cephalotrichum gorgonifer]|uniref:Related to gamma hydroxybutyrate dehydrogenase n=1 Tax=Cephalotrichum gorgonifer TaxID=2041049 RepID=A0AAE8N3W1_9PEZI|nr:related to gamma hydroxybutyrate dehydrogenase [Cephalotrichum gorgonifer]